MLKIINKLFDLSLYPIFRLFDFITPKSAKICVFASQAGSRYFDNSKYLYEHIVKYRKDILAIWLTTDPEQKNSFTYIYSLKGIWYAFRAKHKFISYGLYDFGKLRFSRRSNVIQLWHGVPLKNIFYLENKHQSLIDKIRNHRELSNYTRFICCSEQEASHLKQCTRLSREKIAILGYPRNDFLLSPPLDPRVKILIKKWESVILYAPTYRDGYSPFSLLSLDTLEALLKELQSRKCALLIRGHATETIWRRDPTTSKIQEQLKGYENLIHVNNTEYPDVQDLMKISNLLISDYSGIIIDYLLLSKPVIRYCPDIECYSTERGLVSGYEELQIGELVRSEHELVTKVTSLLDSSQIPKYAVSTFHKWRDARSCERILNHLEI